jgi:hypothetical protein
MLFENTHYPNSVLQKRVKT